MTRDLTMKISAIAGITRRARTGSPIGHRHMRHVARCNATGRLRGRSGADRCNVGQALERGRSGPRRIEGVHTPHRIESCRALRRKSEGEALHLPLWRRSAMPAMCRAWQATGSPPWGGEAPSNCQTGERRQIDRRGSWTACGLVQRPARPPLWISWPASSGHRGCRRCFMTPASPDSGAWCCCDAGSAAPGHAGRAHAGPVEPDMPALPPSCRPAPSV